ncbi:MAG TPA: Hsp70 family protein, partial [Polyangiales bacterium]|nr:Hsp70 family protein [Polyangiales bacterium]
LTGAIRQRLLDQCRELKERLTPSSRKLTIDVEAAFGLPVATSEVSVPVAEYYDACTPLVERTLAAMQPVMARFEGEMQATSALASQVAGVYVVGGASSLPLVPRLLRVQYGRRVHKSPYPSAAVAIGLAIAADDEAGFELSDRFTHTFGVFREGAAGHEITFDPIFTRETRIPARSGGRVSCRRAYRAAHNVGHFRFLECSAVSNGKPAGDVIPTGDVLFPFDSSLRGRDQDLTKIPVLRTSESGPRIEEEYTLDEHGMVAVTIRNLDENYQRVYRVGAQS